MQGTGAFGRCRWGAAMEEFVPSSDVVGALTGSTSLEAAQALLSAQVGLQRDALDLQQQLVEQLLAQLLQHVGIGARLNLLA